MKILKMIGLLVMSVSVVMGKGADFEFNVNGVLPSSKGATYLGNLPESSVFSVSGGLLDFTTTTSPSFTHPPAYQVDNAFSHDSDTIVEWRIKVDSNFGPDFGPEVAVGSGNNLWLFTIQDGYVAQMTGTGRWVGGFSLNQFNPNSFNTFTLDIPANSSSFTLSINGVVRENGEAGTSLNATDSFLAWGRGLADSGNFGTSEWDYIKVGNIPDRSNNLILLSCPLLILGFLKRAHS